MADEEAGQGGALASLLTRGFGLTCVRRSCHADQADDSRALQAQ
jgi:hypothetical protein